MNRLKLSGFWILLGVALLDIILVVAPLTSLAIVFCLLFYPGGIGLVGRWLCRLCEEMTGGKASA